MRKLLMFASLIGFVLLWGCELSTEELERSDVFPENVNVNVTVEGSGGWIPPGHQDGHGSKEKDNEKDHYPGKEQGGELLFKVPVAPGFDWEVTQSWAEHCEQCNNRGYDEVYGDYCENSSHLAGCCDFSWDFNLPGNSDTGKPVLASAEGTVRDLGVVGNWGETVVIDHGDNLCTRYAHMVYDSTNHLQIGQRVCQGLKLGEISGTPQWLPHLHFQFEECDSGTPIAHGFDDGNGVPICTIGDDIYDAEGNYSFLKLTNEMVESCETQDGLESGWVDAGCGSLGACPLNSECSRESGHVFADQHLLSESTASAAAYLWSECALDGKYDNLLFPYDNLSRAEALKVTLFLTGLIYDCDGMETEPFVDVGPGNWSYEVVSCGVSKGVIDDGNAYFRPNDEISFVEAVTMLVAAAAKVGMIEMTYSNFGHFPQINKDHWAYPYVETLYYHGGVIQDPKVMDVNSLLQRWEFIEMAAALSPCFCGNVNCESGCSCSQNVFSCVMN